MKRDRRELLIDLIERRRPIDSLREELSRFPWDSDELVLLERRHIADVLDSFISGQLSDDEVTRWADTIEGRDDIGFPEEDRELLVEAIFELATPELVGSALADRAHDWLRRLRVGADFEAVYSGVEHSFGPSPQLKPLLHELYESLTAFSPDLARVKAALMAVLTFLTTPEGRTDANCTTVDHFLMLDDDWKRPWGDRFPDDFQDVLADMAGALHDTVSAPEIASNFDSTPEQLLARAENLRT